LNAYGDIIGQAGVKDHLRKAVLRGRVSHAYVFGGAEGMGKAGLARAFAKTLQCLAGKDEPCGVCASCRAFDGGNHPDVFYVGLAGKKSIGVNDVREKIVREMETRPYSYRYKVFIVDGAETMTPEAQNALLKTIEEPASYGVFLLLSANPALLLPTVRSRCILLKLTPILPTEAESLLLSKGVPAERAAFLAAYAQGNPGLALRLAESEDFTELRDETLAEAEKIHGLDCAEALSRFPAFEKYRDRIGEVLDILLLFYRDALVDSEARGKNGAPGLVVRKADCSPMQPGLVVRKADCSPIQPGLVVRKADCSPMQPGLVVRKADCSPMQPGLVVRKADCSPMHPGPVVRKADCSPIPARPTARELLTKFYAVLDAKRALAANANFQMAVEVMLMRLSREPA